MILVATSIVNYLIVIERKPRFAAYNYILTCDRFFILQIGVAPAGTALLPFLKKNNI